jgi:hypothetical protein
MQHARSDYRRIQDLAEVAAFMSGVAAGHGSEGDVEAQATTLSLIVMLEGRYGFSRMSAPIPADEPVFLLRAKDMVAPSIVRTWATAAYGSGADDKMTAAARAHADWMEKWQVINGYQVPDMPPQGPCGHCGQLTHFIGPDGGFWCSPECIGG